MINSITALWLKTDIKKGWMETMFSLLPDMGCTTTYASAYEVRQKFVQQIQAFVKRNAAQPDANPAEWAYLVDLAERIVRTQTNPAWWNRQTNSSAIKIVFDYVDHPQISNAS